MDRSNKRLLVIDDEAPMRDMIRRVFEPELEVIEASNGPAGLRELFQHRPDLIVLDAVMPEMDGFTTLRRIRELTDTPVIMLTALDNEADVVRALDGGADEYVTKPFSPLALAARVRALLRRAEPAAQADEAPLRLLDGDLIIDHAAARVWVRGEEVELSPTEYRLLVLLAAHRGQVLTPGQILEHVWGPEYSGESNYVKNYVRLLRGKIEADPHDPHYVLSRRGLGYLLSPTETRTAARQMANVL